MCSRVGPSSPLPFPLLTDPPRLPHRAKSSRASPSTPARSPSAPSPSQAQARVQIHSRTHSSRTLRGSWLRCLERRSALFWIGSAGEAAERTAGVHDIIVGLHTRLQHRISLTPFLIIFPYVCIGRDVTYDVQTVIHMSGITRGHCNTNH